MKRMDITKPTALFSTKIIIPILSVILVAGIFVQCGTPATEVEEENVVEEVFAHENEVLQWYFDKIGFTPTSDKRYFVLISDRNCIGCGSVVLNEMLNENLDSIAIIITSKLYHDYPFLSNNPNVFVDKNDILNTLNWDYPGITDVKLCNGKIVEIHEHYIEKPDYQ